MIISSDDFFLTTVAADPWGGADSITEELDTNRLAALISGPDPVHSDLAISLALMDLIRDDLTRSGTSGGQRITDVGMRLAIRALRRVTARTGIEFDLPFRDHTTWREWWIRKGAKGSYRKRRDLLHGLFDESYGALEEARDSELDGITSATEAEFPVQVHSEAPVETLNSSSSQAPEGNWDISEGERRPNQESNGEAANPTFLNAFDRDASASRWKDRARCRTARFRASRSWNNVTMSARKILWWSVLFGLLGGGVAVVLVTAIWGGIPSPQLPFVVASTLVSGFLPAVTTWIYRTFIGTEK